MATCQGVCHIYVYVASKMIIGYFQDTIYTTEQIVISAPVTIPYMHLLAMFTITCITPVAPHLPLHWRHNGLDGVSNHQPRYCLLNRLFRRRSKKISKLRIAGLCAGNSPVTGVFSAQIVSNVENVPIWWRHHALSIFHYVKRFLMYYVYW